MICKLYLYIICIFPYRSYLYMYITHVKIIIFRDTNILIVINLLTISFYYWKILFQIIVRIPCSCSVFFLFVTKFRWRFLTFPDKVQLKVQIKLSYYNDFFLQLTIFNCLFTRNYCIIIRILNCLKIILSIINRALSIRII